MTRYYPTILPPYNVKMTINVDIRSNGGHATHSPVILKQVQDDQGVIGNNAGRWHKESLCARLSKARIKYRWFCAPDDQQQLSMRHLRFSPH